MQTSVYLDHAATTPLDERVLDTMLSHFREQRGNPSSLHAPGATARDAAAAAPAFEAELRALLGAAAAAARG